MIEVGYFSFCFALLLSLYALFIGLFGINKPFKAVVASARNAIVASFVCIFFASLTLWNAIFTHDFSIEYVYRHSSVDMPPMYLFSSFWSALEGSHLLWTLIMSAVCAISIANVRKENYIYYPVLCAVYGLSLSFMLLLNLTVSAPLTRLFPTGQFGEGMNALLQNPYMAIHPPMLFTGYSFLIVPFAYSAAALVKGFFTPEWFITIKKYSLISWAFLTVAIFLGGRWAYCELGWGGYWAWDPVENSSFMPWLSLTAAIHTFLIYTKTTRLPRLGVFLNMLAFALTFQGTFITRSGIISSVHSFAQSNIGPAYLAWILTLLSITLLLLFLRGSLLEGAAQINEWKIAKETTLLFTIFFLLFMLALVFIGTILPLVIEALKGIKISIQQPFFNSFAPWVGLGFVSILGIGNLMKWKSGKIEDPLSCLAFPAMWSAALTTCLWEQKHLELKVTIAYFMILWTTFTLVMDLIYRLQALHWNGLTFLKFNRSYLGALIIHLGFLMALLGFSGNYQTKSAEVSLNLHQSTHFHGYKITNEGLNFHSEYNVQYINARLVATDDLTQNSVDIIPTRTKFTNNEQWFNEVGIHSTFWHDIYLVLASFDIATQSVSLKMNYNPTVKFVWTSLLVMVIGVCVSLSATFRSPPRVVLKSVPTGFYSALIIVSVIGCCLFAYSGFAHAQNSTNGEQIPMQINKKMEDVAQDLRCPTCLGLSVLESGTPQSLAMRTEIAKQIQQGKSKQEIINYFKARYGDWILREPDIHSSYGFVIWVVPIVGFIAGPLFILIGIKSSRKRKKEKRQRIIEKVDQEILTLRAK